MNFRLGHPVFPLCVVIYQAKETGKEVGRDEKGKLYAICTTDQ